MSNTCASERLKRNGTTTSRNSTYSVYGISLLIAMNTQLVKMTSMTKRLKNVTGTVKDNASELTHRDNTLVKTSHKS